MHIFLYCTFLFQSACPIVTHARMLMLTMTKYQTHVPLVNLAMDFMLMREDVLVRLPHFSPLKRSGLSEEI